MSTIIVIIRESRDICPNVSTRFAICYEDTITIVRVEVICRWLESIIGVVLVAPSLSTDLAVADAVNRVYNTGTSWSCVSSTQLGRCVDLSERGGTAGSWFSHVEVCHSHPPSPEVAVGGVHITVNLSALHGGTLQPVVARWRRRIVAEDLPAGLGWFVGRQSQRARAGRFFSLELSNFLLDLRQRIHQAIIQPP